MKSIKLPVLIIVILFAGANLSAQKVFREGFIIKKSGELLTGLVEYYDKQDIPDPCRFKRFDIARAVEYKPSEIQAFGYINGNRYESRETARGSSFYEVIVAGKITLFEKESAYFLEKDNSKLVELKKGSVTFDSKQGKKEFKNIPEFLSFVTEGKTGTVPDNFNVKTGIVTLITNFNRVSGESYYIHKRSYTEKQLSQLAWKSGAVKSRFGIISGLDLYMQNIKINPDKYGITDADYVPKSGHDISPAIGLTYERMISRRTDRLSLIIDLIYTSHDFYSYSERSNISSGTTRDDAWFSYKGITVPLMFRYSFTGGRFVPYVNLGAAYQYILSGNYFHSAEVESYYHDINTVQDHDLLFRKGEFSGLGSVGTRVRLTGRINLNISLMVQKGQGFFQSRNPTDLSNHPQNFYVAGSVRSLLMVGLTF
jgi:hypothetical protein